MTDIQWTDEVLNVTVGCSRVDHRCDNCYAMGVAHRGLRPEHRGLTKLRPKDAKRPGVDWTGEVRFLPERLALPLKWRKPRRVFVDSMSDLFHPSVPFEQIAAVFGVFAATQRHTYQLLTKQVRRAREFFAWLDEARKFADGRSAYTNADYCGGSLFEAAQGVIDDRDLFDIVDVCFMQPWPLPNVHLLASVSDQPSADRDIPELLRCPAAVHGVSYEPALGPVYFRKWVGRFCYCPGAQVFGDPCDGWKSGRCVSGSPARLDWIIVGGESGPRARGFNVAWARSVIGECREWGTPVFVKQLGSQPFELRPGWKVAREITLDDRSGGDWDEWTGDLADLRVRTFPRATPTARC